ncbi:(deoxy)nucleoside triphosphate pyrophosphohydrolase [Sphingobacterium kitahiroshimense]|uniref:(deoxy)nucleoside triphosphate pyrophosphohydrolase n=1 Tax=Sphingobacterium sp. B16(2022) TaxID=2914044 RepID=UPI001438AF62|nr:(deoxy)nucleoside triphosphate pyrophosphohydrolase [Sphingobacterium sp. B16(2022)]NJI71953.1 (deoxy)nucleoside triphosphate pyrophosphohydrolase [Sphingobacterium sp. B16(2022)]
MAITKVLCGLIIKDNQILICRRKPEKSLGGYWEFPGGKLEDDETYEACLARELQEELDLRVTVKNHFKTVIHQYDLKTIELISYRCETEDAVIKLVDHDQIEWIAIEDLLKWELAPADVPIAEGLIESFRKSQ